MLTLPPKVQPGDLIACDQFNFLRDFCIDLHERLTRLEQPAATAAGMQITALLPSGTVHIGDQLHIIGAGFDVPSGNIITIDSIGITSSAGTDKDRELIVTIPNVQGVTPAGKNVTVLVSNSKGTDMRDLLVFPAVATVPEGQLFVKLTKAPTDAKTLAGQSYTFEYSVQAITDMEERYALSATVSTGWTARIVDAANNPIEPEISMPSAPPPAGTTQTVRVRVAIPNGTADGTSGLLRLAVTSNRNPGRLVGRSGGETITANSAPPSAADISITLGNVTRFDPAQPAPTTGGGVVRIGPNTANYRVAFSAQIKAGTVYAVQLTAPTDARWVASLSGTSSVTSQNIGPVPADTNQPVFVFLRATTGAPDADLVLRITSTTESTKTGLISQPVGLLP